MKKAILKLSFITAIIISGNIYAQKGTSEINLKYGTITSQEITNNFDNAIESILGVENDGLKSFGSITGSYEYFISDKISVGTSLTYQNFNKTFTENNKTTKVNSNWFIPMANVKYLYSNNNKLQLYGKLGLGYAIVNTVLGSEKGKNENEFAYQITPIGLRYGNKLGIILEAGYGYQGGIISTGLSFNF